MKIISATLILSISLTSCTHYYYVQNAHNVPLFREEGEYRLSASSGGGDESNCTEIQTAYSVNNHMALMANFMTAKDGDNIQYSWAKGKYYDGAVGYYSPLGGNGVFEVYGGVGTCNQHHQYGGDIPDGTSDLTFTKYFVQPSIGLTFKGFDIALSARISKLYYNKIVANPIPTNYYNPNIDPEFKELDTIAQNRSSLLFEPAITIRGGWKYVKVQMQFAKTNDLTFSNLHYEQYHFTLGLYIAIAQRYWRDIPKNKY